MLSKITNREKALLVFLIAALLAIFLQKCATDKAKSVADTWQSKYEYEHQTTAFFKNKLNEAVAEQKVVETGDKKLIKDLSSQVFDLKRKDEKRIKEVEALVRIKQTVKIDSIPVPYAVHDTIPAKDSTNYDNWVHVPKKFSLQSDHFQISGRVLKQDLLVDSLRVPDTLSFRIAEKRQGLFKPRQTIVEAIHSNPLIQTEGLNSMVLKKPKTNAWNKIGKPLIGVAAGIFLGVKVLH